MGTLLSQGRMCTRDEPGDGWEVVDPFRRSISLTILPPRVCASDAESPVLATSEGDLLVMRCFGAFRTLCAV